MANSYSIKQRIAKSRLRWIGHVIIMDNERIPKRMFYRVQSNGKTSKMTIQRCDYRNNQESWNKTKEGRDVGNDGQKQN